MLEARGVNADPENLEVDAEGRIEEVDGKMLLTHVTLKYRIKVPKNKRESVERALAQHDSQCAVCRKRAARHHGRLEERD